MAAMQQSNHSIVSATGEAFVADNINSNAGTKDAVSALSYQELLERQDEIQRRLKVIAVEPVKTKKPHASGSSAAAAKSNSNNNSRRNSAKRKKTQGSDDHQQQQPLENQVPVLEKNTDVHWDFTMKEMMWLATDFQAERKRQMSLAKKIAAAIRQHHKTRESRQLRELAEAELRRRRLAGRIGREVRGWWTKIERVIAYKQKCSADEERRQAMNKQLVTLVKQTEKYTESLIRLPHEHDDEDSEASISISDDSEDGDSPKKSNDNRRHPQQRKKRRKPYSLTIEEALAVGERSRRSKKKVVDYNRLHLEAGDGQLYGESTASDTGSDNSYSPDDGDEWVDDESTLLEAEAWETKERLLEQQLQLQLQLQWNGSAPAEIVDTSSFTADPRELRILREERDMPIEDVLERYRAEAHASESATATEEVSTIASAEAVKGTGHHGDDKGESIADAAANGQAPEVEETGNLEAKGEPGDEDADAATEVPDTEADNSEPRKQSAKRVSFALSSDRKNTRTTSADGSAKYDADDDGDASDVEDFVYLLDAKGANGFHDEDEDDDASEEFEADQNEVDDETTMAQEEQLPQEMSPEQEISLLKAENEMSIEELRKMYAGVLQTPGNRSAGATHGEATMHVANTATNENATTHEATTTDAPKGTETHDDMTSMDSEDAESNVKNSCDGSEMFGADVDEVYDEARHVSEEHNGRPSKKQNGGGSSLLVAIVDAENEDDEDEDEFEPDGDAPPDDETTIEAEERLGREMSYEDEISLLNKENEMSIEELRAKYLGAVDSEYSNPANGRTTVDAARGTTGIAALVDGGSAESESEDPEDDAEFVAEGDDVDDETTMEAEEHLGREMSPEEELAMLQRESETPIESLYEMYQKMEAEIYSAEEGSDSAVDETEGMKRKRQPLEDEEDANGNTKRAKKEEESADEGLAAIVALEKSAERARRTLASRPYLLAPWVRLRAYQQTGLNWLVSLQTRRLNGILADEMGLGKTLQTISLLAYLAAYKGVWGPHLVIVPTSVIVNWETELKRFCPGLKALCYYGSAKRRKELRSGWTKTNWYHVVVTSYQLAVQDAFAFKRKRWYYLILDEAQNIKNFQSQRWQTLINFNTQRRLLLTGTPLQNNLMELWSLLHFLMPYIFRSRKEFSFWFSNPMNSMIEGTGNQNEEMIARLHGIIRPFILRRLKKDVETQLPGKFEHVVKCPLSRRQMFFYEEFMARSSTRQALKKGGNYMGMMTVLMQLRKVCNHPDLFEPRSVVTPFVLKPISLSAPECVVGVNDTKSAFCILSKHVISPLWCGSTGMPSMAASHSHDELLSKALRDLEDRSMTAAVADGEDEAPEDIPRALADLLEGLDQASRNEKKGRIEFQRVINSRRCRSPPFPCSSRLQRTLRVRPHPIYELEVDFLSTPLQLLAMRRNQQERADQVDDMIKNFVVCVPKAGAPRPTLDIRTSRNETKGLEAMLLEPVEEYLMPFRKAHARLTSFFPDKKFVQFDAGKLQTLAELLHDLKRGGHRVLIFTQMSKMLDILEAFLNLNGHTYVRLDGSTGVERRQRLMDRFNVDPKIFTFILSTRSGGMGINLTGADTVIFYDSDWNPAMDAQAQDRAHRIGQTRDVHIYRLITEHSVEENILIKAQQKRNLDIIVMDKGKFDGSSRGDKNDKPVPNPQEEHSDVFTKGGLRAILGVTDDADDPADEEEDLQGNKIGVNESLTREQMEAAMANLEDKDDVLALRGAQKEAAEELREFDETVELLKESDNEGDDEDALNGEGTKVKAAGVKKAEEDTPEEKNEEDEMVKEFAAWQDDVGLDTSALVASLSPTETYGFHFRQEIDPFYSIFAVMEERRRIEALEETKEEIDIDQIEKEKAEEERRAIEDGDLLATGVKPEELVRQRNLYIREKARLKANKKRRKLTGENWEVRKDTRTDAPFWYNLDTGEALWDKPTVLLELEAEAEARKRRWPCLPLKPLVHIMSFLVPYPDRISCTRVCRRWRLAAQDHSFVRHVYPVEMGALGRDDKHLAHNHYRTIADALSIALPGDTVEFGDGHYWVSHPGISVNFPLKLVGDEQNASNVVVEMSGTFTWKAKAGWIEGVTFRRPKIAGEGSTDDMLKVASGGRVDIFQSVIDNTGSSGASAAAIEGFGSRCRWEGVVIKGGDEQGIKVSSGAKLVLEKCEIRGSRGDGVTSSDSEIQAARSSFELNAGFGATLRGGVAGFVGCKFDRNSKGILNKDSGCKVTCSRNTAPAEALATQTIPGFQAMVKDFKTRG